MPKIFLYFTISLFIAAFPEIGMAASFSYEFKSGAYIDWDQNAIDRATQTVYKFVTNKIPEPKSILSEKIHIVFENSNGMPASANSSHDMRSIKINTKKIKSIQHYQLALAHEFTHILRYFYNPDEEIWLDEGLAKLVEVEYSGKWSDQYDSRLKYSLDLSISNNSIDYLGSGYGYVTSYFLLQYLYNLLGEDEFLRELGTSSLGGWGAIESAAQKMSDLGRTVIPFQYLNREALWTHYVMAQFFNDSTVANGLFYIDSRYVGLLEQNIVHLGANSTLHEPIADVKSETCNYTHAFKEKYVLVNFNNKWHIYSDAKKVEEVCNSYPDAVTVRIVTPKH